MVWHRWTQSTDSAMPGRGLARYRGMGKRLPACPGLTGILEAGSTDWEILIGILASKPFEKPS